MYSQSVHHRQHLHVSHAVHLHVSHAEHAWQRHAASSATHFDLCLERFNVVLVQREPHGGMFPAEYLQRHRAVVLEILDGTRWQAGDVHPRLCLGEIFQASLPL